jgi:hypothetical protein
MQKFRKIQFFIGKYGSRIIIINKPHLRRVFNERNTYGQALASAQNGFYASDRKYGKLAKRNVATQVQPKKIRQIKIAKKL